MVKFLVSKESPKHDWHIVIGEKSNLESFSSKISALSQLSLEPLLKDQLKSLQTVSSIHSYYILDGVVVNVAVFENKLGRNLGLVRGDSVPGLLEKHLSKKAENVLISFLIKSEEEAFPLTLAVARSFPEYNQKTDEKKLNQVNLVFYLNGQVYKPPAKLQIAADAVRTCGLLVDQPASELTTSAFVDFVKKEIKSLPNVKLTTIQGEELKEKGFGGMYGVGKASEFPPCLVHLHYEPEIVKSQQVLCWVGKGIVFDTGGLSLKSSANMCTMKSDLGGAAAIFSAFKAAALLKPQFHLHAILCLAENSIDSKSTRVDDILYMHSGLSVEVNNTDAEGRLVLADGVSYATRVIQPPPTVVLDMATLTGAQLITTGTSHAAVLTYSEQLEQKALQYGKESGDWVFPILYAPELLLSQFDSVVADLKNSVKDRMNAQSSCAGHFIEKHLEKSWKEKNEWLHMDIAGPSFKKERGTGFGVGFLIQMVLGTQ